MNAGRLLGVDFGLRRVGFAVCDADRTMAAPLCQLERKSPEHDARRIRQIVAAENAVGFVVGLPLHMNGDEGDKAREARSYGEWLARLTGLTVEYWDERCTTAAAEDLLWNAGLTHKQRKERRDKLAAAIILQSYLDSLKISPFPAIPTPPAADG